MLRKNRKLPIIVGSLATIALVSVGFSAWLIGGQINNREVGNVNVEVGSVNDNRLEAVISDVEGDVKFDANGSGTLIDASNDSAEDMLFGATITVGLASRYTGNGFSSKVNGDTAVNTLFSKLKFELTLDSGQSSDINGAFSDSFAAYNINNLSSVLTPIDFTNGLEYTLQKPATQNVYTQYHHGDAGYKLYEITESAYAPDANTWSISFVFGFGYNEFFNWSNPTAFTEANGKLLDSNTESNKGAIQRLQKLYKLNDADFTLTVSTIK